MKKLFFLLVIVMFLCASCSDAKPENGGTETVYNTTNIGDSDEGSYSGDNSNLGDISAQEDIPVSTENPELENVPVPPDKPEPEDAPDPSDKPDQEDALVLSDKPDTADMTETSQQDIDEALRLYLEYINEVRNDSDWNNLYGTMSLAFINDDDIPELVIDRYYPINGIIICTVSNGAVETILAEGAGGGINYIDRGNRFTFIAIKKDAYYDIVCCIKGGKFVTLHEGSRDAGGKRCLWDGEVVSFADYNKRYGEAFASREAEYTGMNAFRAADMIYDISLQLSDSPSNVISITHDPISGLLTSDGAFAVYESWRENHPDTSEISRQSETYKYNGEQYFLFPAKYTYEYYFNILVHMETGQLLYKLVTDGMNPITLIEPLDNWYGRYHSTPDSAPILDIVDYSLPQEQNIGDIFNVSGVIESNNTILSVSVTVYNVYGDAETGGMAYPLTNTYDIGSLDDDLLFDKLTHGSKTYVIEATDETGTITLSSWFWVNE